MRGLKRWMLAVLIAFPAIAVASEKQDASSAEVAIAEAEAAVKQASSRRALWTSVEDALRRARRALQEGNAAMAIEQGTHRAEAVRAWYSPERLSIISLIAKENTEYAT